MRVLTDLAVVLACLELFKRLNQLRIYFIVNLLPISLQVLLDLRALLYLKGLHLPVLKFLQRFLVLEGVLNRRTAI